MFSKNFRDGWLDSDEHKSMSAAYGSQYVIWPEPDRYKDIGRVTYGQGLTVRCIERNGYHDSDFSVVVYNKVTDCFDTVSWGTTRFPTYDMTFCESATPEIYALYTARKEDAYKKAQEVHFATQMESEARRQAQRAKITYLPNKGDRVTVLRGKNKGREGRVFWIGESKASRNGGDLRYNVGVQLDGVADATFFNANLLSKI